MTEPDPRRVRPEFEPETPAVRPYALTAGRTRPPGPVYPIEALVAVHERPAVRLDAEPTRIVELATVQYISIAELSARLHLPAGVVRVLVGDLVAAGVVRVHGPAAETPAVSLRLLENVLIGIAAL